MTININVPPGLTHWGPGVFFPFQTNIAQPSGAPFTITVDLWRTSPEQLLWHYVWPVQQNIQGGQRIFYDELNTPLLIPADTSVQQGENVLLKIEARDDAGLVVDQGEKALPWSPVVQLHNELVLTKSTGTVQGGFAPSDRTMLSQVLAAVYRAWPRG
jgi:hypothetical protein